jgi:hypothetical protein
MNDRSHARVAGCSVALLALCALASPAQAHRCDAPKPGGEARACAADAQGPEALRRFIERTRMIYGLYYYDLRREEPEVRK